MPRWPVVFFLSLLCTSQAILWILVAQSDPQQPSSPPPSLVVTAKSVLVYSDEILVDAIHSGLESSLWLRNPSTKGDLLVGKLLTHATVLHEREGKAGISVQSPEKPGLTADGLVDFRVTGTSLDIVSVFFFFFGKC